MAARVEVTFKGEALPALVEELDVDAAEVGAGVTLVVLDDGDQADLMRLIARIDVLGLELLAVRSDADGPPGGGPPEGRA